MLTCCYFQMSHIYNTTAIIAESKLNFVNDTGITFFGNMIFEMKSVTQFGLLFNYHLQFITVNDVFP